MAQQYAAAIARMLAEIDILTKENTQLAAEAKSEMLQLQAPRALTTRELLDMDPDILRERTGQVVQKRRMLEERNKQLLARIQLLQTELIQQNELEGRLQQLASASAAQAAVQKALENQLLSAAVLKAACKRNESAINQLEKMLEVQSRRNTSHVSASVPSPLNTLLREEIQTLQSALQAASEAGEAVTLDELRARIEEENVRVAALEQALKQPGQAAAIDDKVLEGSVVAAEREAAELQKQMLDAARRHAQEQTDLELKILEADARLQGGFGALTSFVLSEMPPSPTAARLPPSPTGARTIATSAQLMAGTGASARRPESGPRLPPLSQPPRTPPQ